MIIIDVCGGLGNQMFQYALYVAFVNKGKKVMLDYSHVSKDMDKISRCTILDSFVLLKFKNINDIFCCKNIIQTVLKKIYIPINEKKAGVYDESVFDIKSGLLIGYWQTEKYFKQYREELREAFRIRQALSSTSNKVLKEIEITPNAISVHVRLGDYDTEDNKAIYGNICTTEYYRLATKHMLEQNPDAVFFVFSNDIEKAKRIMPLVNTFFVEGNDERNGWEDMYLMSKCKHHIIANSTFSWWGAWLNNNPSKIVIAPKIWLNTREMPDICPEEWIRI